MEKAEVMLWVNRTGLFLDLFAFWLMIPELLGEKARSVLVAPFRVLGVIIVILIGSGLAETSLAFIGRPLETWLQTNYPSFDSFIWTSLSYCFSTLLALGVLIGVAFIIGYSVMSSDRVTKVTGGIVDLFGGDDPSTMSLRWGMILFSLGFLLQLIATF